jgi:hypothetical protein
MTKRRVSQAMSPTNGSPPWRTLLGRLLIAGALIAAGMTATGITVAAASGTPVPSGGQAAHMAAAPPVRSRVAPSALTPLKAVNAAGTTVPGTDCPMFPSDNVWNTPITSLPVDNKSATWLAAMGSGSAYLHPDYGPSGDPSQPYGIPYIVVPKTQRFIDITFQYASESDPGPYPFGANTPIEGGKDANGDRHAIMVDPSTCTLYELWDAYYRASGSTAGSGAIWKLTSNALRPAGWTSADAAGLPILAGLVNYDQVASGAMDHAIRVTAECTQQSYVWPARHEAGLDDPNCPPMGARFRLKASFNLPASQCSAFCQTVIKTMKTYGLILADNGSNWFFQGTADTRWTYDEVDQLKQIPANEFEAVDESSLMVNPNSGQAASSQIAAVAPTPDGKGYFLASTSGVVTTFGDAHFYGDAAGLDLKAPIVAMAVDPATGGYWLLGRDGGVFSYHAPFLGSTGNEHLNAPAVGLEATPSGTGYRLVASDGGIFDFGAGAHFYGSEGARHLNAPVVGMADDPSTGGYWLVAADGGVFSFEAPYLGSTGNMRLNAPIVEMESLAAGDGYRFVAADGGVFDFGAAKYSGSLGGHTLFSPVVGMASEPGGAGYWIVQEDGIVSGFGGAPDYEGSAT